MKFYRFLVLLAVTLFFTQTNAQITAYINGKPIKPGATVDKKDLASLEVSFKNAKKTAFTYGVGSLYVDLINTKKVIFQAWKITRDGNVAINDFFTKTPAQQKFKVFDGTFHTVGNTLDWILTSASGDNELKTIQVKIGMYVAQETGYEKYGQPVDMIEPFVFNVPVWNEKNLYLPFLDLSIDKTNVKGNIESAQTGFTTNKDARVGYELKDEKNIRHKYSIYAFNADDYPGLNTKELADNFIHVATMDANQMGRFKDYDVKKYNIPWKHLNDLTEARYRLARVNSKLNKDIKGLDLMTLYEKVEINGLKGYKFQSDSQAQVDKSAPWHDLGKFVIYILDHPTNPKLTLVLTTFMYNDYTSFDDPDAILKSFITGIKH